MSNYKLIQDYKEQVHYRLSFNQLADEIFGIDFEQWYQFGMWNDRYICYSFVDGDKVIANVSVSKLELLLNGERKSALQIGTVMTHPDYRKQGLAAALMKTVLEEYENKFDVIYLFPEDSAIDFYRKFGFKEAQEGKFVLEFADGQSNHRTLKKLDVLQSTDREQIVQMVANRTSHSQVFGIDCAEHITTWFTVNGLRNVIYSLEQDSGIVFYKQNKDVLHIFDVVTKAPITFHDLLNQLTFEDITKVVFHFTPDFSDLDREKLAFQPEEIIFAKPESLQLPTRFAYPFTAHA